MRSVGRALIRPTRRTWWMFTVPVILAALVCAVLFLPPPISIVRALAMRNASWLLSNSPTTARSRILVVARKLTASYVQYGLASEFRRTHPMGSGDDVQRIAAELWSLRQVMLNQVDVPHTPVSWSSILSGLGFCDQMNAIAANVLGGAFPHAEIVGLRNSNTGMEHTVGRLWSRSRREWLYFDLWGDIAVFRIADSGGAQILAAHHVETKLDSGMRAAVRDAYAFAPQGRVINEYPRTFGIFVIERALRPDAVQSLTTSTAYSTVNAASVPFGGTETSNRGDSGMRRAYADAQLTSLIDGAELGRAKFARIAASDSITVFGRAAREFLRRGR